MTFRAPPCVYIYIYINLGGKLTKKKMKACKRKRQDQLVIITSKKASDVNNKIRAMAMKTMILKQQLKNVYL